ncbi:GumC family protein [Rufibacter psychrotolerans]|uniref:GumC family protein n=1 Tax=Rufibacter psychrotolerans TaxID=2812556 RepID=UPI00196792B2|nr:Wzz/FepE/Etk N-terminal domain-containing protein [Rufibacter sp. SYSU D00308]
MKLKDIFRLISRNLFLLLAVTSVTAASIYFFTKDQDDEYTSNTTIYTGIASGYNLSDVTKSTTQYKVAKDGFANLISIIDSRDIRKELGFRLFATHIMLKKHDPNILSEEAYQKLQEFVPGSVKARLVGATLHETAKNVAEAYNSGSDNPVKLLIDSGELGYSADAFSTLEAKRIGDSDLLQISYYSGDPAQCKNTLDLLTQLFLEKHRSLFTAQSESVVDYFTKATDSALTKLKLAEDRLLAFQQANNIIDYNSQVGSTTTEKNTLLSKSNDLEIEYAGALSTLRSLEQSLKARGIPNLYSQEVLQLKGRLAKITTEVAELELLNKGQTTGAQANRLNALKKEADDLSKRMLSSVDKHYDNTHTVQGLPTTNLLADWVRTTFLLEELKSKRGLVNKHREAYAVEYEKLMPLGAENRKLTRDVTMAEQEYLAKLEGLNQSKLNQQNIEITSQLKVIDPPFMPGSPTKLTRILLILFGSMGVFLLTLGGLLAHELLDESLRKPSIAAKKIEYPIFGVLPATNSTSSKQLQLAQNAEDQLARQLILKMKQKDSAYPFVVGVLSSMSGEGKTVLCNTLANNLISMGIETQVLYPKSHKGQIPAEANCSFYAPLEGVLTDASIADLAGETFMSNTVVIVEFPAVLEDTYPVSLFKHLDLVLLTVKANRVWQQADKTMFENIRKVTSAPIETVLSSVQPDYAKEMVVVRPKHTQPEQKALQSPKSLPALETV